MTRDLPVIVLTRAARRWTNCWASSTAPTDYLTKPFSRASCWRAWQAFAAAAPGR